MVDLAACRAAAAQLRRIRRLEDQAAAAAGISAIFAEDDKLAVQPSYAELLQGVLADAADGGAFGGGRFARLPLRVQRQEVFRTDSQVGHFESDGITSQAQRMHEHWRGSD